MVQPLQRLLNSLNLRRVATSTLPGLQFLDQVGALFLLTTASRTDLPEAAVNANAAAAVALGYAAQFAVRALRFGFSA
eukprot:CAMPEP_0178533058 /NCGR_PEP_ID=MMETSP0696-20121128/34295_1 /TAXON_ID=265572 /ORGANISM="Extubocellulus spinifer, Strain CCMP396" /LENGTH=77 /DNA_ID=CAMNT_0020165077 /DNA_START=264 /DNA_END=497 /DNA_ORIENTATION=+